MRQGVTLDACRATTGHRYARAAHRLKPARRPAGDRRPGRQPLRRGRRSTPPIAGYRAELDRQLASHRAGRGCGCPRTRRRGGDALNRSPTCGGPRDLPVLIVAGVDRRPAGSGAGRPLVADLEDGGHRRRSAGGARTVRPARRGPHRSRSSNRGMPSFNVEARRATCTSRSCGRAAAGRPGSGSTRPGGRRPTARTSSSSTGAIPSTTRPAAANRRLARGRDRPRRPRLTTTPLVARLLDPIAGPLPATASFSSRSSPPSRRPDRPQARRATPRRGWPGWSAIPAHGVALRLYRVVRPTDPGDDPKSMADRRGRRRRTCSRRTPQPLARVRVDHRGAPRAVRDRDPRRDARGGRPSTGGCSRRARGRAVRRPSRSSRITGCTTRAPRRWATSRSRSRSSRRSWAATDRSTSRSWSPRSATVDAAAGTVVLVVPPLAGTAAPTERIYRLAPGAHLAFEAVGHARPRAPRPVAISWPRGSRTRPASPRGRRDGRHCRPGTDGRHRPTGEDGRAPSAWAVERALHDRRRRTLSPARPRTRGAPARPRAASSRSSLLDDEISVAPGRWHHAARLDPEPGGQRDPRRGPDPEPARDVADRSRPGPRVSPVEPGGETIVAFDVAPAAGRRRRARTGRSSRSCTSGGATTRSPCRSRSSPRSAVPVRQLGPPGD